MTTGRSGPAGAGRRLHLLALAAALLSACHTSPPPERYPPARDPRGVAGTVAMRNGQKHEGELLAIDDSAYVLLVRGRVGVAPFTAVNSARFAEQSNFPTSSEGAAPTRRARERARLVSRFPFGIPPVALAALLAEARQDAPDDLSTPAP